MLGRAPSARCCLAASGFLVLVSSGCDESPANVWYLGPIDAQVPESGVAPETAAAPTPQQLVAVSCVGPVLQGPDALSTVRWIATSDDRVLITVNDGITAFGFAGSGTQRDGCPGAAIKSFGSSGHVTVDAAAAAPLPAYRTIAVGALGLSLLDAAGVAVGTCTNDGGAVRARLLATRPDGTGYAAFTRLPITTFSTDSSGNGSCATSALRFENDVFALHALAAASASDEIVAVVQPTAYAPLTVAKYKANGQARISFGTDDPNHPAHLCSAVGILETNRGRVLVADGTCRRVAVFDSASLEVLAEARFDDAPRGVARAGSDDRVLVPVARTTGTGAEVRFAVVTVP